MGPSCLGCLYHRWRFLTKRAQISILKLCVRKHPFELENYLLREAAIDLEIDDYFALKVFCWFFLLRLAASPPMEHVKSIDCSLDSDERRTAEEIK